MVRICHRGRRGGCSGSGRCCGCSRLDNRSVEFVRMMMMMVW